MRICSTSTTLVSAAAVLAAIAALSAPADSARAGSSVGSRATAVKGPAIAGPNGPYGGPVRNPPKGGTKKGSTYTPPSPRPGSGKSSNCQPSGQGCTKQY